MTTTSSSKVNYHIFTCDDDYTLNVQTLSLSALERDIAAHHEALAQNMAEIVAAEAKLDTLKEERERLSEQKETQEVLLRSLRNM